MTLAHHIEQDLRRRLLAGQAPPRLTLSALAEEYGVSHMPVRAALTALVGKQLLVRPRTGGPLEVDVEALARLPREDAPEPPPAPIDPDRELRAEVVRLSLHGYDGYLREKAATKVSLYSKLGYGGSFMR